jgi:sarcosine oxidase subunit delta
MLRLTCPICDVDGEETEFHPGGEAHITREGPGSSDADFAAYLFYRKNPKGVHFERWRHAFGCGKWFHVARCTATLEVFGSYRADTSGPTEAILDAMAASTPRQLGIGNWHLPYGDSGYPDESAACCARISYDSHDGGRATPAANQRLAKMLKGEGHWSPFEHIAFADAEPSRHGNLSGNWAQYRKIMGA